MAGTLSETGIGPVQRLSLTELGDVDGTFRVNSAGDRLVGVVGITNEHFMPLTR